MGTRRPLMGALAALLMWPITCGTRADDSGVVAALEKRGVNVERDEQASGRLVASVSFAAG